MSWMRARANALSVRMRTWWPSNETAWPPSAWIASATRPTVTCSPVDAITSSSRSSGRLVICLASPSSRLVSPDIAETMTTTSCPLRCVARQRLATLRMRSTVPTDVPPYFCTINKARALSNTGTASSRPTTGRCFG